MKTPRTQEFKGFADWIEIFRSGPQTASDSSTKQWEDGELDEMAANFDASNPFPLVIGHPKTDSPAYGWGASVKRDGPTLFARFGQVHDGVNKAAQSGAYRNRSIKVAKGPKGWKIVHVGLLGAAPPAVEGLAPVYSADAPGETYEFGWAEAAGFRVMARGLRSLREWMIEKFGLEAADKALPSDLSDSLSMYADDSAHTPEPAPAPTFNAPPNPQPEPTVPDPKTFTQADLDAAIAAEKLKTDAALARIQANEFAGRLAANTAYVQTLTADQDGKVRLLPAQAEGVAEFLTRLQGVESAEFEFAAGDETKKQSLFEFAKGLLGAMPPQLQLGGERAGHDSSPAAVIATFNAPEGVSVDASQSELYSRAKAYQAQHPGTDWIAAVHAVGG